MTKFAFVFPGQGSQDVGMLAGFSGNDMVRETLEEASGVLGFDVAKLISEGPKESLDLTVNTQPVMLTSAIAIYRAWRAAGGVAPTWVAGHSLGEYSALVAAGALSFRDALPLVRFRAQVMQDAVPLGQGGMAVLMGLSADQVRSVCAAVSQELPHEVVQGVNFNAPEQVVIAGHLAAVERACVLAKEHGAKRALKLPVSAPFHSSLLEPAALRLRDYLQDVPIVVPDIAVVNNVDVAIQTQPDAIRAALVRQAFNPVRWVDTIQQLAAHGASHVIECGPGKVLTGLTKRIASSVTGDAIHDQASLDKVLALLAE